jgi:hypothetical protein
MQIVAILVSLAVLVVALTLGWLQTRRYASGLIERGNFVREYAEPSLPTLSETLESSKLV